MTVSLLLSLLSAALVACGCGGWIKPRGSTASTPDAKTHALPPAAPIPGEADEAFQTSVRFLEARVRKDPDDFIAYNLLHGYYLRRVQETGDVQYLELAERAARASLAAAPAELNTGGLAALAQTAYTAHDFVSARDHALKLKQLEPGKTLPYQLLAETLVELGDYDGAQEAFRQLQRLQGDALNFATETRLARLDLLYGRAERASERYTRALALALDASPPSRETVAWCRWQLGEVAFARGDYEEAERRYQESLVTYPDYNRALAALGRVRAARGDIAGGIEYYERAVKRLPDPSVIAALGDLYKLAGREREAAAQYALVEQIARLGAHGGALYNRQLALFYADHDLKASEAYALAAKEYEVRRDIYGADALAWTALKAGKTEEARAAIKDALRLGTEDARLFYHAGMIARSAGDAQLARKFLERALALNPQFDPLQARIAREALTK
ncbi:MAG TPA: tetratricopeptide repeat protein [Pyrinomonadaceae bacterium]|nr:tetratricopeptide repeat protein [Pyrinomonadaceae bacterium]